MHALFLSYLQRLKMYTKMTYVSLIRLDNVQKSFKVRQTWIDKLFSAQEI